MLNGSVCLFSKCIWQPTSCRCTYLDEGISRDDLTCDEKELSEDDDDDKMRERERVGY